MAPTSPPSIVSDHDPRHLHPRGHRHPSRVLPAVMLLGMLAVSACADRSQAGTPAQEDTHPSPGSATAASPASPPPEGASVSRTKYDVIAFKYHADTQVFNIRLSGGRYSFSAIPQSVYDAFIAAGAQSAAFESVFSGTYTGVHVSEDPSWMRASKPADAGL